MAKTRWEGQVLSVQPRIRLTRSFDQRSHTYQGYVLRVRGTAGEQQGELGVAIGKAAQEKQRFRAFDVVSGEAEPVVDPDLETADYYKASKLKVVDRPEPSGAGDPPPWRGVPPDLPTYRERGHRRLDARTYESRCRDCIWGCRMPVEMIIDHWNPGKRRYRFETFCYGPKSCPLYRAGPVRKVPGRQGMTWTEEDWVDEDATAHRDWDE